MISPRSESRSSSTSKRERSSSTPAGAISSRTRTLIAPVSPNDGRGTARARVPPRAWAARRAAHARGGTRARAVPRPSFGDTGAMRVLVREEIAPAGVELLRSRFEVDEDRDSDLGEIIDLYDAIVIRSATKLTADLIAKGTSLKVIGRAGVGVDNVDVDAATRQGIVVSNAPGANVVSAAEHT